MEQQNTEPAADDSNVEAKTVEPDTDNVTDETTVESGNAEAKKYRLQRNEARQERDAFATRLETLQRSIIDERCNSLQVKPAGFWASGVEIAALLDGDGNLDNEKVKAAIKKAADDLGLRPPMGVHVPGAGNNPQLPRMDSWTSSFKPRAQR